MKAQILTLPNTKQCTGCKEVKLLTKFGKDKQYKSGIAAKCKECHAERVRMFKSSPKGKAQAKSWRAKNRERTRAQEKLRRQKNLVKVREKERQWRKRNAYRISELQKNYRRDSYHDKIKHANLLLKTVRIRALRSGMEFSLRQRDIVIPEYCPVLGFKLVKGNSLDSASVDRINNNKGYTPDNIIIVSRLANSIKNAATPQQILSVGEFYKRLMESRNE